MTHTIGLALFLCIPVAATDGDGFPGLTVAASNASWDIGHQPQQFEQWARVPEDKLGDSSNTTVQVLSPCWNQSVLHDTALGWPGLCLGLDPKTVLDGNVTRHPTMAECKITCENNVMCSVWQFNNVTKCYQGKGDHCFGRSGDSLTVEGAQRIQHGSVRVLKSMQGIWVSGLRSLGVPSTGTPTQSRERCQNWCYSNLDCRFWQYGDGGCFVEDPVSMDQLADPITLTSGVAGNTTTEPKAGTMIDGEFIQHYCPPPPIADKAAPYSSSADNGTIPLIVGLIATAVVASLVIAFCYCYQGKRAGKRAVKKTRAIKVVESQARAPTVQSQPESVPLMLPPLMQPSMHAPPMAYAAAPSKGFAGAPAALAAYQPVQTFQRY